jgi:hypothetical protein
VKTISLKKVSAVAVASLGFGLLSVVPAQAAGASTVNATAILASFKLTGVVGTQTSVVATQTTTNGGSPDAATSTVYTASVTVAPTGSTAAVALTAGTAPTDYTFTQTSSVVVTSAAAAAAGPLTAGALGTLTFTPDVPGEYRIAVTPTGPAGTLAAAFLSLYVSGTGATVASSGIGTTTVQGVAGGQVKVNFVPAQSAAGVITASTTYQVTSTGGSIVNATAKYITLPTNVAGATYSAAVALAGTLAAPSTTGGIGPMNGSASDWTGGAKMIIGSGTVPVIMDLTLTQTVAGTQTVAISSISATTGAPTAVSTITITWSATAAAASAAYSTSFISSGTACGVADATVAPRISATAASAVSANICIAVKDSNGNAMVGQALTATVSGPGLIDLISGNTDTTTVGTIRADALTATVQGSTNLARINISADGTSGTSVITILNGTTVLATETLYFYGTVATLTATQNLKVARSGTPGYLLGTTDGTGPAASATTAALTPAVVVVAKDANGVVVPSLTITGLSSDTTVIASAAVLEAVGTVSTTGAAGPGTYLASVTSAANTVSGKTATVTFRTQLSSGAYISAAPVTFTLGGSVSTETITFNKTSYAPGEAMTVTVTAKDSAGNAVYDGVTSPTLTASKAIGGALPSGFYVGGVVTNTANTLFAPALGGSFSVNGTSSNTAASAITASSSVTDANAGLLTQIDALNAKIVALNALIAKIMKKLGVK